MDADAFRAELSHFTGSTKFYLHWTKGLSYTEGVRYLAKETKSFWLIDMITILQVRALKDSWLREFQLWELFVTNHRGTLVCSRDSENEAFRKVIETTDFPLDYVRLYVEGGVLLLPSEH